MIAPRFAAGLVAGMRFVQVEPENSHVSVVPSLPFPPPNMTVTFRTGSYAIACWNLAEGASLEINSDHSAADVEAMTEFELVMKKELTRISVSNTL